MQASAMRARAAQGAARRVRAPARVTGDRRGRPALLSAVLALVAIGVLGVPGAVPSAGAQSWSRSSSPEDLRYRLDMLDAELADIRARLGGAASAPRTAAGALSGSGVSDLEGEVRRLTAMVEELQNRQVRIAEEAARRFSDIEFRLTELEGGDLGSLQPVPPLGGISAAEVETAPQPQFGVRSEVPATGSGIGTGAQIASVPPAEQGELDRAAEDVIQGRFDQGEDRLRRFLAEHPASPLTGEAWYWLGESQFVRGNHSEAARSFLNGYNADRVGSRAPHNLYRLGMTLGRLGQTREACLTLREVPGQFPRAPDDLVGKARAAANDLGCG